MIWLHSWIRRPTRQQDTLCWQRLRSSFSHQTRTLTLSARMERKLRKLPSRPISCKMWKGCERLTTFVSLRENSARRSRHWHSASWLLPEWYIRWMEQMLQILTPWIEEWQRWWRKPWSITMWRAFLKRVRKWTSLDLNSLKGLKTSRCQLLSWKRLLNFFVSK